MPSRDEKRREEYLEMKENKDSSKVQLSNTITYEDNEFEMMSIPDGGIGSKEALENLGRANK